MPDDPTPLGDAMTHRFPEQRIPQDKPGADRGGASRGGHRVARDAPSADVSRRPPLPEHPKHMAADVEDEESDPVIDTGPGIADGPNSKTKGSGDRRRDEERSFKERR